MSLGFFFTFPMSDITSHSGEFEFVAIFTGSFRNLELMEVLELTFFPHVFQFAARTSEIQDSLFVLKRSFQFDENPQYRHTN